MTVVTRIVYSLSFYIVIYPVYLDPVFYGISLCHKKLRDHRSREVL
nr:MAG TPA: PROTEIN/RNA Complex complex, RNA-RNA tertiary interactions.2A [Caudoviricetes sp.]